MENRKKPRVLFMAEDVSQSHVVRPLLLAQSLDAARYDVCFATGKNSEHHVKAGELAYVEIETVPSEIFMARAKKDKPIFRGDELCRSVEDDLRIFKELRPDFVVCDFRASATISAEITDTPLIFLLNAHYGSYSTQPLPVLDTPLRPLLGKRLDAAFFHRVLPLVKRIHARPLNQARQAYGLEPLDNIRQWIDWPKKCQSWYLYLDVPELSPTNPLPANHHYIGPDMWSPNVPLPSWWGDLPPDKPVVYLTLGYSGEDSVLPDLLNVLSDFPVSVIFSSAGNPIDLPLPSNLFAAEYLPGHDACKRANLILCNGGKGTVYQSLNAGTPVLGVTSNIDQYFTMWPVVEQGAGIALRARRLRRIEVAQSIERLLHDVRFRGSALRMQEAISRYDAKRNFCSFMDSIAYSKAQWHVAPVSRMEVP
ncbi:MAG: glycosyl transferase family 1 [Candidatus Hydrogenedentota bacterium]